jgi:hypothetical protein
MLSVGRSSVLKGACLALIGPTRMVERLLKANLVRQTSTPAYLAQLQSDDMAKWGHVVKASEFEAQD